MTRFTPFMLLESEGFGKGIYTEPVMNFKRSGEGFLESPTVKIPVGALDIGTITPAEIWRAFETSDRKRYFSTILAFDVDVTPEASQLAEQLQVKVICGGVLETLHQHFKEHVEELTEDPKMEDESIFPGILSILTNAVFSKEDPIVLGVLVVEGFIKVGVPIAYVRTAGCLDLGRIAWIEKYHQPVDVARLGEIAVIKIVASNQEEQRQARSFGRHYDINNDNNILVTRLSRRSINAIRDSHRDKVSLSDVKVMSDLKCVLNIKYHHPNTSFKGLRKTIIPWNSGKLQKWDKINRLGYMEKLDTTQRTYHMIIESLHLHYSSSGILKRKHQKER
ncbi:hypothetical protein Bca52824_034900 [Brassica carinata]|uniref:Elongation factor Tu-type domain-containing protein n=1 Tax=Brassica carinata TaxID=52824 RepID=A0A8X7S3A2_BRACI|nr:hypothetical protein Bca52824_034900 [Brassica carinata]